MNRPNKTPGAGGRRGVQSSAYQTGLAALYGTARTSGRPNARASGYLPRDWRERLPDPLSYYRAHLEGFTGPNASGNASAVCPLHADRNASLSVNVTGRGLWHCFAGCGGGDMVGFHMRRTGLDFVAAVRDLLGLRVTR